MLYIYILHTYIHYIHYSAARRGHSLEGPLSIITHELITTNMYYEYFTITIYLIQYYTMEVELLLTYYTTTSIIN